MFSKEILGRRVEILRKGVGLSQQDLASRVGVGKSAISMVESGQRGLSVDSLYVLADVFGVSLDYLVGRDDVPNRRL